jgi:hypothetical protein
LGRDRSASLPPVRAALKTPLTSISRVDARQFLRNHVIHADGFVTVSGRNRYFLTVPKMQLEIMAVLCLYNSAAVSQTPVIFDSNPSQVGDMMIDIRGWKNFIPIVFFSREAAGHTPAAFWFGDF